MEEIYSEGLRVQSTDDDKHINQTLGSKVRGVFNNICECSLFSKINQKMFYSVTVHDMYNKMSIVQHGITFASKKQHDMLFPTTIDDVECGKININDCIGSINRYRVYDNININNGFKRMLTYKDTHIYITADTPDKNRSINDCPLTLSVIRTPINVSNLHEFVKRDIAYIAKEYKLISLKSKHRSHSTIERLVNMHGHISNKRIYVNYRNFKNTFITDEMYNILHTNLTNFIKKKDWYKEHQIPYHFGILLYGEPGGGKTAIAQAIANMLSYSLYMLSDTDISCINDINDSPVLMGNGNKVLLIEDIDNSQFTKRRDTNVPTTSINIGYDDSQFSLGTLLNSIDGVTAPSNIIYIFTTNCIDDLDPALIRPGRIDLKLEIKSVCYETFKKFAESHYNINLDKEFVVRDGVTFADLQVKVMSNYTSEQLIDYVKEV